MMKTLTPLFFLVAALGLASCAVAKVERTVTKRFDVQPGGTLTVDADRGSIRVTTTDEPVVTVEVLEAIAADDDKEADELLKDLTLTIEQKGADVGVTARVPRTQTSWFGFKRSAIELTFVIKVPRSYHAQLKTAGGSIRVDDLKGNVVARTSGGSLKFGKIEGDVEAHTSGGSIGVEACTGRTEVKTSGGGIRLGRLDGPTDARTSGGSIHVDEANDVFKIHTSGGGIHLGIAGPLKGDCEAGTSGGGIDAEIERSANFNLDARTSGGSVTVDFPMTVDAGVIGKKHVAGKVNAGGPTLKLRTSGGGIRVDAR